MAGFWGKKETGKFYHPGEEIKINRRSAFAGYDFAQDPLQACKNRMLFVVCAFILVYMTIAVRTVGVCLSGLSPQEDRAENDLPRLKIETSIVRSDITDRNGTIIATSLPTANLFVHPRKIKDKETVAAKLSEYLPDMLYEDILALLNKDANFVYIRRNLSLAQSYRIYALGIEGLGFENVEKRVYPQKNLFAHVIGKTNIDNIGISGLEKELDDRLTASDVPLELSLDLGVQDTLRRELKKAVDEYRALGGAAILMEVATGDIKAISNFDRAEKDSIYFEGVNHAVLGYEPGSVVKPISMMIALEDKVVSPNEKIATGRSFPYRGGKPISDSHAYTSLTPAEIIAASSNIGMSKITIRGFEDNPGRFYSRMKQIGMLDPLNIGIAGETVPRIDSLGNKNWDCIDLTRTSYGYRTQIPPIYTLAMYNAMANGGKFVRPRLVKELWKNEMCDSVIPVSYVRDRVCSPENAKLMRDMLTAVVWSDKGTGKALRNNFVKIAGKTGTCYMIDDETGKYVYTRKRMAFCGFFPADNPKYSCMVLIAHPINAGAARSSGMVLMNTALKMYARGMLDNISDYRKEEKPERTFATLYNINQDTRKELQATLKDANEVIRHRRTDKGVPSVIGMGSRDAIRILEKAGLNVKKIEGEGYVCAQSLQPGTDYKRGSNISLQLKKY